MSFTVALTGGIGSGKSTIANAFAALGVNIIDADVIAREVIQPGSLALKAIVQRYNKSILNADGTLCRSILRKIIFGKPKERNWINQLLHPLINKRTQQLIKNLATSPYIIWVIPLLIENKIQCLADRVLVIDINETIQLQRTKKRDNILLNQAKKIIATQTNRERRLQYADDIIDNNGRLEKSLMRVIELHNNYITLSSIRKN
ncbi:dephospho-CoA kinase [Pantoea sp. Aalb]|uniref:dephospho-CoA kinase n=1 Tax=Pantoea sp. Aalb TaxID=2576762 RepID=UPI0013238654|nr:dephospho-CoA kinase [Pantoea sp. Aalb]MXP67195.1 dephospho-CoA kinase [Pantoea sp. Aalb]